jgi:ribosomal protein S18 acetylase RimI-like enzyme
MKSTLTRKRTVFHIRTYIDQDLEPIVQLSLLAWEPVFHSFEQILGKQIYPFLYPDWRKIQKDGVETVCRNRGKYITLVAERGNQVVGFVVYESNQETKRGEVILLAVHPDHQNDGIGTELNLRALEAMKAAGMELAVVETGGDESHAPARRSYEKAGYTGLPLVRYFKKL